MALINKKTIANQFKLKWSLLVLLLIISLGAFLRIYHLGNESLWLDEACSIAGSQQSLISVIETSGTLHNQPPLYFVILHFWMILFGTTETAVRSLSVIFGIITIFLMYKIGDQLFNRKVALVSSFLASISGFLIQYSQEARGYSLLVLLTLVSYHYFLKILKIEHPNKLYFFILVLINVSLVYTHVFGLFVIFPQIFYIALFWNKYKQIRFWFFGICVTTFAFYSPWIPTFFERAAVISRGFWINEPSIRTVIETLAKYSGIGWGTLPLLIIFFILCLVGLFPGITFKGSNVKWNTTEILKNIKWLRWKISFDSYNPILLLLMWFTFPVIFPFLISLAFTPIYATRYTISSAPALYIMVARGISSFSNKSLCILVLLIALFSFPGLTNYYIHPQKEQWREATTLINNYSQPGDVILIYWEYCQIPFDYYYEGNLPRVGMGETSDVAGLIEKTTFGKQRMWLVLSHQGSIPVMEYLMQKYGETSLAMLQEFKNVTIYLFDLNISNIRR